MRWAASSIYALEHGRDRSQDHFISAFSCSWVFKQKHNIMYSTVVIDEKISVSSKIITNGHSHFETLAAIEFRLSDSFDMINISSKGNFHGQRNKYSKKWS